MNSVRWFLLGVISFGAIALLAAALVLLNARGFSARQQPTDVEGWIARWLRSAALPSDARARANPVPNTPEVPGRSPGALGRSLRDLPRE